ncbi:hypothetical protein [Phreatobacter sp.]|uniref:hypothetical protein n=1 Tax=Phreatobacter sp. TaxID=1966341 RepID=UPI0025E46522|nr:hypothetical protein [Phreatobacter sp.]
MANEGQTTAMLARSGEGRRAALLFDTLSPEGRPVQAAQVRVSVRPGRPNGYARMAVELIADAKLRGSAIRRDGALGTVRR